MKEVWITANDQISMIKPEKNLFLLLFARWSLSFIVISVIGVLALCDYNV